MSKISRKMIILITIIFKVIIFNVLHEIRFDLPWLWQEFPQSGAADLLTEQIIDRSEGEGVSRRFSFALSR